MQQAQKYRLALQADVKANPHSVQPAAQSDPVKQRHIIDGDNIGRAQGCQRITIEAAWAANQHLGSLQHGTLTRLVVAPHRQRSIACFNRCGQRRVITCIRAAIKAAAAAGGAGAQQ